MKNHKYNFNINMKNYKYNFNIKILKLYYIKYG